MMRCLIAAMVFGLAACRGCGAAPSSGAPPEAKSGPGRSLPGLSWVEIPAHQFTFGCEPQDTQCKDIEKPGKTYAAPGPIRMTQMEITVAQYGACAGAGACPPPSRYGGGGQCNAIIPGRENHPMNCVNLEEAEAFCHWIGGHVPSAEEWEYAAKGGESRIFPWGNDPPDPTRAQYEAESTAPVGTHPAGATPEGLDDMAGNVWEWTSSMYDATWAEVRGGSWRNAGEQSFLMRCSERGRKQPAERTDFLGFRCAR